VLSVSIDEKPVNFTQRYSTEEIIVPSQSLRRSWLVVGLFVGWLVCVCTTAVWIHGACVFFKCQISSSQDGSGSLRAGLGGGAHGKPGHHTVCHGPLASAVTGP